MFKKMNYVTLYFSAIIATSKLYAQVCDPQDQACLTAPEGILKGSTKATDAINLLNWLLFSASMVGAISFGMKTAKRMSDETVVWSFRARPWCNYLWDHNLCGVFHHQVGEQYG